MKRDLILKCNFCQDSVFLTRYAAKKSRISLSMQVCRSCSLFWADCDSIIYEVICRQHCNENAQVNKISYYARYPEIQVGKQRMAKKPFKVLTKYAVNMEISSVSDMRSTCEDFVSASVSEIVLDAVQSYPSKPASRVLEDGMMESRSFSEDMCLFSSPDEFCRVMFGG